AAPRALFERLPRLADLVPFTPLADGLPTAVEQVDDRLWVQRDDRTASVYGGNKVRKLEFVLPVARRRGGPVLAGGGIGSPHVLAAAIYTRRAGPEAEVVAYPQPGTPAARRAAAAPGVHEAGRLAAGARRGRARRRRGRDQPGRAPGPRIGDRRRPRPRRLATPPREVGDRRPLVRSRLRRPDARGRRGHGAGARARPRARAD